MPPKAQQVHHRHYALLDHIFATCDTQKIFFVRFVTPYKMKFVCAGYPKTGSKSASAALRMLGYNVADYIEELG